jgi:methyltransferase (TIGR00027 family)
MVNRREMLGSIAAAGAAALCPRSAQAMAAGEPSRTALGAALHRAAHQLLDQPLVFPDALALKVLGHDRRALLRSYLARQKKSGSHAMRAFIVMRSRYAEDQLASSVARGTRQYIVLGAGLDTFAYRNPFDERVRVFEVDHPATQDWKRKRLDEQGIGLPSSLTFVPVDFETDNLGACLDRAGFDRTAPVCISWLGVTIYLTREAVFETLRFVAQSCASGSAITFDFAVPDAELTDRERSLRNAGAARVAEAGEPWISYFNPEELTADLRGIGFAHATGLEPEAVNARYFSGRVDGFRVTGSGRMMTAGT